MRLWPKFLTYGNWGGAGWSGGKFTDDKESVCWDVPGIDAMDIAFKMHDYGYQYGSSRRNTDIVLCNTLLETNVKGNWANFYKIGAIVIFSIKSLFEN